MSEWKTVRITKEAWKKSKKMVADQEVDLDDFLSFIIESADLDEALAGYLKVLEEDEGED